MKNSIRLRFNSLFFILFSGAVLSLNGQPPRPQEVMRAADSMKTILLTAEDRDMWSTYIRLDRLYFAAGMHQESYAVLREYMSKADSLGDVFHGGNSRMYLALNFFNNDHLDSLDAFMPSVKEFMKKHAEWRDYFYMSYAELSSYMARGQVEKALECANIMYAVAEEAGYEPGKVVTLGALGEVYHAMGRLDEAVDSYKKSLELAETNEIEWNTKSQTYNGLLRVLIATHRNEEALAYCREFDEKAAAEEKAAVAKGYGGQIHNADRLYINMRYATIYMNLGDYRKAENYLKEAERHPVAANPMVMAEILYTKAHLMEAQGHYKEALAALQQMDGINRNSPSGLANTATALKDMGDVAYKAGEYRIAADSYKEMAAANDSLRKVEYNAQIDELRTVYEVDRLTAEKEKQRLMLMWAVVGCILLALIVVVYVVYSRRLRQRNLSLYRQIQENLRVEKEAEKAMELIPEEQLSKEMKLFVELNRLMHSEKLFTDPVLDRRALAARLGTNEKYLSNAIHEGAGVAPSAYISDFRLAYSLELLTGQPDMTFDQIALESGHGSYSSFFRAFVKKYGIGPSEYRRLSEAKDKHPEQAAAE